MTETVVNNTSSRRPQVHAARTDTAGACLVGSGAEVGSQGLGRNHAQTETAAWRSNSICVVPTGYPKPAIPYY